MQPINFTTMRRSILFLAALALMTLVACETVPSDLRPIKKVPGIEVGRGDDAYTTTKYKGATLPEDPNSRGDMVDVLKMVGDQNGAIDDQLFVELLQTKVFECNLRFMYIRCKNGEEPAFWSDASDWCGGQMIFDLVLYNDGTLAVPVSPSCAFHGEAHEYIHSLGHKGWSKREKWRYDAENDMLYTSEDDSYAAKVLYFDGECAVLEGYVYPMWLYLDKENVCNYRRETPMELYYFNFKDDREGCMEGYSLSYEEYAAIINEYRNTVMSFEGKYMPDGVMDKMRECIALMEQQQPEDIDDAKFVDMLLSQSLTCADRFMTNDDLDAWNWGTQAYTEMFDVVSCLGDMIATDDGGYVCRTAVVKANDNYDALVAAGCMGWYDTGVWSYDAESNTLKMERGDKSYESVVHYFDATTGDVVLRGVAGFVLDFGYDTEMLRCKFTPTDVSSYIDGYLSYADFTRLWNSLL